MRRISTLLSFFLPLFAVLACAAQTKINPNSQINWPLASGAGAPSAACSSANYGQPYTDTATGVYYVCSATGWAALTTNISFPLSVSNGGTGATTASSALANLGGLPLTGGTLTGPLSGTSATFSGTVAAGKTITRGTSTTPSYPATANETVPLQFATSRYGRTSVADMPALAAAMANYDFVNQPPIIIAAFGSSIGVGANLTNPATDAACSQFVSDLQADFPGPGGLGYNFQCVNMSVNGSVATQYPAAWQGLTQYALNGVAISAAGTGYAVGDWETVNTGANGQCGAVIVTSVGAGGSVTGIKMSPYPGTLTDADTGTDTTCVNMTGNNFPTLNGPPANASIPEQTGTGSGLTVNVTSLGYTPTAVLIQYQMNDAGPLEYNAGQTVSGFTSALGVLIDKVRNANADAVLFTSHHPSVVLSGSSQWAWNTGIPCYDGSFMSVCNTTTPGNTSTVNQATSVSNIDPVGLGTTIELSSRMQVLNTRARALAEQFGASVLDVEKYWDEAMECSSAVAPNLCSGNNPNGTVWTSYGSQSAAETALFTVAGPHINTLGASVSYWPAIRDFVAGLRLQTAQPTKRPPYPYTAQSGIETNSQFSVAGPSTSSVTIPLPANTAGTLTVWASNAALGPTESQMGFTACSTFAYLGPEVGTNIQNGAAAASGTIRDFAPSISGLTVTLTNTVSAQTYYYYRIDTATQTQGCPASGTSLYAGNLPLTNYVPQGVAYNIGAGGTVTVTLPDNSGGSVTLSAFNTGVAQSQIYSNTFTTHNGTVYLLTAPKQIGAGTEFTGPTVSGLTLTFTNVYAATNYQWTIWPTGGGGASIHAMGVAGLASGTATVTTTSACVPGSSCVYKLTNCGAAGTAIGTLSVGTVTAGSTFVINSLSATNTVATGDTSNICWQIE